MVPSMSIVKSLRRYWAASSASAALAALFHNGKEVSAIRSILAELLGHPQSATPIVMDNSTASGLANDTVFQERSKAMDMRFYWVRDCVRQPRLISGVLEKGHS